MELDGVSKTLGERGGARLPADEDVFLSYGDNEDVALVPGRTDGPMDQNERPRNVRGPRLRTAARLQTGSGEQGLDFVALGRLDLQVELSPRLAHDASETPGTGSQTRGRRVERKALRRTEGTSMASGRRSSGRPQDMGMGLTMLEKNPCFERRHVECSRQNGHWAEAVAPPIAQQETSSHAAARGPAAKQQKAARCEHGAAGRAPPLALGLLARRTGCAQAAPHLATASRRAPSHGAFSHRGKTARNTSLKCMFISV